MAGRGEPTRRTLVDTDIWSEIFKEKNTTVLARAATCLSQHGRYTLTAVTVFDVIKDGVIDPEEKA